MGCCHKGSVNIEDDEELIRSAFIEAEVTYFSGFIVYSKIKSRDYIKSESMCEDFITSLIYHEDDSTKKFESQKEYLRLLIKSKSTYNPPEECEAVGDTASKIQDFRNLGLFCVFYAGFNTPKQRKSLLVKHVLDTYGRSLNSMRNFLYDLIELNTTLLLSSFQWRLRNYELYIKSIWTDEIKRILLEELMSSLMEICRIEADTRHNDSRRKNSHLTYLNNLDETSMMNNSRNESFMRMRNRFNEDVDPNFDFVCEKFVFDHFPLLQGCNIRRRLLQIHDLRS